MILLTFRRGKTKAGYHQPFGRPKQSVPRSISITSPAVLSSERVQRALLTCFLQFSFQKTPSLQHQHTNTSAHQDLGSASSPDSGANSSVYRHDANQKLKSTLRPDLGVRRVHRFSHKLHGRIRLVDHTSVLRAPIALLYSEIAADSCFDIFSAIQIIESREYVTHDVTALCLPFIPLNADSTPEVIYCWGRRRPPVR